MLSYDQALQQVIDTIQPLATCQLPLAQAGGQVLSAPALSQWAMPRWDNSAMDGFAFAASSVNDNTPLKIVGSSFAGHPFNAAVQPGEAVQITTGAVLPQGTDSVIPIEQTLCEGEQLWLHAPVKPGQHVRYHGEEYNANETLVPAGRRLQAGEIGLLASGGVEQVSVRPRPRVAIFSTGDELVELGQQPGPGQIVNSNLHYLISRIKECGATPIPLGIGVDRCDDLKHLLSQADDADLLLTTGGVSVGAKDLVQQTLLEQGFEKKFWKVAIKPGKPVLFGTLQDKPIFGLPGNPAATAATFELFVRPALSLQASGNAQLHNQRRARLHHDIQGGNKRQTFLWCRCEWSDDGYYVETLERQGSGQTRSIQGANALLPLPIDCCGLTAGEKVEVLLL